MDGRRRAPPRGDGRDRLPVLMMDGRRRVPPRGDGCGRRPPACPGSAPCYSIFGDVSVANLALIHQYLPGLYVPMSTAISSLAASVLSPPSRLPLWRSNLCLALPPRPVVSLFLTWITMVLPSYRTLIAPATTPYLCHAAPALPACSLPVPRCDARSPPCHLLRPARSPPLRCLLAALASPALCTALPPRRSLRPCRTSEEDGAATAPVGTILKGQPPPLPPRPHHHWSTGAAAASVLPSIEDGRHRGPGRTIIGERTLPPPRPHHRAWRSPPSRSLGQHPSLWHDADPPVPPCPRAPTKPRGHPGRGCLLSRRRCRHPTSRRRRHGCRGRW